MPETTAPETTGPARHSIRIAGFGEVVPCDENQSVIAAIEAVVHVPNPLPVGVGCRKGGCGACRVRVTSGEYRLGKISRAHVTEAEQAEGFALACKLTPLSDLVLEPAYLAPGARARAAE